MALRERDPNASIGNVRGTTYPPIGFSKAVERKKALPAQSDANKENQPPSPAFGTKSAALIKDHHHPVKTEPYLTEKWIKDSSLFSSQDVLTPPPKIHRTTNGHVQGQKQNLKSLPRSHPMVTPTAQVLPPGFSHNDKLEGYGLPKHGEHRFTAELDILGRTRQADGVSGKERKTVLIQEKICDKSDIGTSIGRGDVGIGMDFSAALRQNLDTPTTCQEDPPKSRSKEPVKKTIVDPKTSKPTNSELSIRSVAASKDIGAAEHAEFLLRQMLCDYHEGLSESPPDGGCFNSVVHAYASRGDAAKAETVLALMWHEFYKGNLPPDKRIFTTVMYAWQRSEKKVEAPDACEHLLRQMHQLGDTGMAPTCGPDTFTYTCILHCWANSGRPDAASRAESLFRAMLERYENGDNNLEPDTICYSNLINVFVNCGNKYHDAERILWEMVDTYLSGLKNAVPTVRSFNTLLAVWSKSNFRESPERVEMILHRWRDLNRDGRVPAAPDEYSYALLLKAWTKTNRSDSVHKLLESFEWIKTLFDSGEDSACPDVIKYTTVIGALNKAGQVDRAFMLLGELINKYNECKIDRYKPDARCFHIVLTTFSRTKGNVSAGKKAESLLRRMWTLYKTSTTSDVRPTNWTYNTVIFCYQNAGDPKRAERLLREMDSMARMGSLDRGADIRTYKSVVAAWRASNDQTKHLHIRCLQEEASDRFKQQI